ncbi:MAG TPA: DUF882 domain-containing protein [Thermodesulfovibrionales bacterium]|nr:DUF882 domain-containing protein [Thermodesulfovibrionales bacterium]
MSSHKMGRRDFLTAGLLTATACLFPFESVAAAARFLSPDRALSFYNAHTGENMKTVYWQEGAYLPQALADINYILRDYRTGEVKEIDIALLDLLFSLLQSLESPGPFHVISGYRSQKTNSLLRFINRGVVKDSLHIEGKAIDIRLPGRELTTVRNFATGLQRGGVGYYPFADFVHLDVGRIRYW